VLESASLTTVADEFNRYSSRKLVAIDHGVSPLHLSGVFYVLLGNFTVAALRLIKKTSCIDDAH